MEKFETEFFRFDSGICPMIEYLDKTEPKMRAKILRMIGLLEQNGNMLPMPYSEPIDDGIFELRTKLGSNISRALYFSALKENSPDKQI